MAQAIENEADAAVETPNTPTAPATEEPRQSSKPAKTPREKKPRNEAATEQE